MGELDPILESLYSMAIHRVILVGQAETAGKGILAEALAFPGLSMVLAAPPRGGHWLRIGDQDEWIWGGEPHGEDAICVLLPGADVEIGELYRRGRALLEGGCESLALLPTPWREKFDGRLEADPGCREKGQGPG
jgi:hypothetical protein